MCVHNTDVALPAPLLRQVVPEPDHTHLPVSPQHSPASQQCVWPVLTHCGVQRTSHGGGEERLSRIITINTRFYYRSSQHNDYHSLSCRSDILRIGCQFGVAWCWLFTYTVKTLWRSVGRHLIAGSWVAGRNTRPALQTWHWDVRAAS